MFTKQKRNTDIENGGRNKEANESHEEEDDDDSSDASLYEGITEFHGEESGDLSFRAGEVLSILSKRKDGWWTAENNEGKIGLVPSTYLEPHLRSVRQDTEDLDNDSSIDDKKPKNSEIENIAKDSWNFCPSTLSELENEDNQYSTSAFLQPKLNQSGLSLRDINWDDVNNNLKANIAKCQRLITLTECRYLPEIKTGLEISSYHIRICLHDGSKVLSNIHTVRAKLDPKEPQNWIFSSSVSQIGNYLEDGRIFIRTTKTVENIGILFQPCLIYSIQNTHKKEELSYGWAFMTLFDVSGNVVPNKSKILYIHGGYPFEETVLMKQEERRMSKNLVSKDRFPCLMLRIATPDREIQQQLNLFPDILIGPASLIPHISLYRQTLAECLLHQRSSSDSSELLQAPVEATFPKLFKYPDILDAFRKAWVEKIKNEKKSNKKNREKIKQLFREVYKETAYLLIHCNILPPYSFGDIQVEQSRQKEIERLMRNRQIKGCLGILLAPNVSHQPFYIHEASLDIVGEHCIPFV